jgi:hypothetical protein
MNCIIYYYIDMQVVADVICMIHEYVARMVIWKIVLNIFNMNGPLLSKTEASK